MTFFACHQWYKYVAFCEDDGFQPLSRATMFRVLKVREASQRKSLQGLDNVSLTVPRVSKEAPKLLNNLRKTTE